MAVAKSMASDAASGDAALGTRMGCVLSPLPPTGGVVVVPVGEVVVFEVDDVVVELESSEEGTGGSGGLCVGTTALPVSVDEGLGTPATLVSGVTVGWLVTGPVGPMGQPTLQLSVEGQRTTMEPPWVVQGTV